MDGKFEILYTILKDMQDAGALKHVVLVGSWCQEFHRRHFENSFAIPATRTMDADILIPRLIKMEKPVDLCDIFIKQGFVPHHEPGLKARPHGTYFTVSLLSHYSFLTRLPDRSP